jgi:SET domain-containing protein
MISWVSNKLELSASKISGRGYVAKDFIKKGEILIVQGGQILHVSNLERPHWQGLIHIGFQVESEFYILSVTEGGAPIREGLFSMNHSCEPNAGFSGQITLVSMRDISAGEEITYDYAMTDRLIAAEKVWSNLDCLCRSRLCRKVVTPMDWQRADLQVRYRGYFSTHVERAIHACHLAAV